MFYAMFVLKITNVDCKDNTMLLVIFGLNKKINLC